MTPPVNGSLTAREIFLQYVKDKEVENAYLREQNTKLLRFLALVIIGALASIGVNIAKFGGFI